MFVKKYVRRFKDSNQFEQIFSHILFQAIDHGFVNTEYMYADSTHVNANTNKRKFKKEIVEVEAKANLSQFEKEINEVRVEKKPLSLKSSSEVRELKVSTTDLESGLFVKNERERVFAYSFNTRLMITDLSYIRW